MHGDRTVYGKGSRTIYFGGIAMNTNPTIYALALECLTLGLNFWETLGLGYAGLPLIS